MSMKPTVSKKNGFHNPEIKKWNRQNNDEHKLNQRVMFRILVHPGAQAALTLFGCTIVVTIWESRTSWRHFGICFTWLRGFRSQLDPLAKTPG